MLARMCSKDFPSSSEATNTIVVLQKVFSPKIDPSLSYGCLNGKESGFQEVVSTFCAIIHRCNQEVVVSDLLYAVKPTGDKAVGFVVN